MKAGTYFHNRFCTFVKYIQIEAKPVNGFASICVVSLTNLLKSITSTTFVLYYFQMKMRQDAPRILVLHGILGEEQLGGASADAQSYWQGRFAACAYVECV